VRRAARSAEPGAKLARRRLWPMVLLPVLAAAAAAVVWFAPIAPGVHLGRLWPPDLAEPRGLFIDWRLASIRHDPELCRRVLRAPLIEAVAVEDVPSRNGCGIENAVRLSAAGGARIAVDRATCELAAAMALWLTHEVQPAARSILGGGVASLQHRGGYACRNMVGTNGFENMRSEHATANALDISAFILSDGRHVSVLKHWGGGSAEARFLAAVQRGACRYFRVVLGPAYNAAHRDHFHLDRGSFSYCQ
jgi:hypothetical protein